MNHREHRDQKVLIKDVKCYVLKSFSSPLRGKGWSEGKILTTGFLIFSFSLCPLWLDSKPLNNKGGFNEMGRRRTAGG